MRGRTLNDAVVILDEAQNTTSAQIKMFLTRMGWNTKMIITGDRTQIDLPPHNAADWWRPSAFSTMCRALPSSK